MAEQIRKAPAILRLNQVKARTGLSRSSIYAKISEGEFPAQVSLGKRAVGFIESEIDEWIARRPRIDARNKLTA